MTIEAEVASGAALAAQAALATAQAALATAQAEASATTAELAEVRGQFPRAQDDVVGIGREAYMGSDDSFGDGAVLMDADSPTEVLQPNARRTAVAAQHRATRTADETVAAAEAQLSAAQGTYDALAADKATLDAHLREAEIRLLDLRGAVDPAAAGADQQASSLLSAASGALAPTTGRVTSCYGSRSERCTPASTSPRPSTRRSSRRRRASCCRRALPAASDSLSTSSTMTGPSPSTATSTTTSSRQPGGRRRSADRRGRQQGSAHWPAPAFRGPPRRPPREPRQSHAMAQRARMSLGNC